MKQWEYRVREVSRGDDEEGIMNEMGALGWELVTAFFSEDTFLYFKRPLPEKEKKPR